MGLVPFLPHPMLLSASGPSQVLFHLLACFSPYFLIWLTPAHSLNLDLKVTHQGNLPSLSDQVEQHIFPLLYSLQNYS